MLLALALACAMGPATAAVNVLQNPGFEIGSGAAAPPWLSWAANPGGATTAEAHSGSRSWEAPPPTAAPGGPYQEPIPVIPGTSYSIGTWVKVPNASPTNPLEVRLRIRFGSGATPPSATLIHSITTSNWVYIGDPASPGSPYTVVCPAGDSTLRCAVYTYLTAPNTVYVDDFECMADLYNITGQVTSGGVPVAGAIVGVKSSPKATADAQIYAQADSNGNYSVQVPDGTWYAAAWNTGWTPSADSTVVVSGGNATADLELTKLAGANIVSGLPSTSYNYSSQGGSYPASYAIDGNINTRWSTTSGGTEYFLFELDPTSHGQVSISGLTAYTDIAYPYGYRIDVMATEDPLWPMNWDDPAYYTTVYETAYGTGGYQQNVDHWVNPIRFDSPMMARGLRLYLTAPHTGFGNYSYWEIQVHSGTQYGTMVRGYVKDTADNPIYNAVVQLGGITGQTIITGPSGYFEFATTAGTHELYGDASGYGAKFTEVSPTAGSVVSQNLVLSAKSEVGAYNGSFEAAAGGDPTKADGWDVSYRFSPEIENMGGVDANGNPWPTPPADHYVGSRVTTENTTPSGSAGGWLKTNNPLPPPPPQVDYWGTILDVYWYWGILKPSADRRIPVTAGNQYNFYFKWKQEIAGFAFYEIQWQRADGSLIKRQRYYPWGNPPASWTQAPLTAWDEGMGEERPTIRMSPPADAAYIEPRVGLNHFHDQKIKDPTWVAGLFVDDLVVDEIVPPTVTGKVRDTGGNPVSGAIVGIKKSGKATADAMAYAETDVNGNYSIGATSGTHYLAAWKEGWTPSADTVINVTGDVGGVDLVLSSPAGANVAQGKPYKESTNWGEDIWDPAHGVDGDWTGYESRYATVGEGDQYYIIDLDPTSHLDVALSGITINWENRRCASYRIDAMPASAGVDPLDPANWTPANYSTVYSVTDTPTCGYHLPGLWPDNYVDPIRLTASARAIRVFMTKGLPQGMGTYVFFEVRAHSAALTVEKIGELKSLPLGTPVTLTGKMVTAAPAAGGVPSGVFYMEETDRSAGIRVSSVTAVAVGNSVVVSGALAETAGGELYIEASTVTPSDGTTPPPLAANTKTIADSLMNALLIKTAGTVRAVGADYFTIADGYYDAGAEVQTKVLTGGAPGVSVGEFVVVKGVASYDSGRVILKVP